MVNWFAVHASAIVVSALEIVGYGEVIESRDEVEIATYDAVETAVNAVEIASETPLDVVETAAQWNVMGIENEGTGCVTAT